MTEYTYSDVQRMFAHYGFTYCPLTDTDVIYLQLHDVSLDGVYSIGCDIEAGYTFKESFEAYNGSIA